jgi:hypothetical protein
LFGKLEGKEFVVEKEKLYILKKHIADNFYSYEPNEMMIDRLQKALDNNQKFSGADASFYFHELREAELMKKGYYYEEAHNKALQDYEVSAFSVYHPDVIVACWDDFNQKWRDFWGIL